MSATLRVIDCALVCNWSSRERLYAYLPRKWQDYVAPNSRTAVVLPSWRNPEGDYIHASHAVSPFALMDVGSLDQHALSLILDRAILFTDEGGLLPGVGATYFVQELVRAANEWLFDQLETATSQRLYGLILASSQQPDLAAREIRRQGKRARAIGVHLRTAPLGKPFGHPIYHPIYKAAADLGLPVVIEVGGDVLTDTLTHPTAGGLPMTFGEFASLQACALMTHLVSMISAGVFRKFADLRVMAIGGGAGWLPWFLWRMDAEWKGIRREIPWVDVLPSQYFRDRIRIGANPLTRGAPEFDLGRLLGSVEGIENMLCYASNYPRWNADSPKDVIESLPSNWHERILFDNAAEFFPWKGLTAP